MKREAKGRAATKGGRAKPQKKTKTGEKPTETQLGEPKKGKLTPRNLRFCEEYVLDLNATQAAIRAGYSEKSAHTTANEILKNPKVQQKIAELQDERSERTRITADYVLTSLREVVERCMQKAPVMVGRGENAHQLKDEHGADVWEFDSKGAIGALKLLGDHLGLYKGAEPEGQSSSLPDATGREELSTEELQKRLSSAIKSGAAP